MGADSHSRQCRRKSQEADAAALVNSSYFPIDMRFTDAAGIPVAMAELIGHDGRPFRDTSTARGDSPPVRDTSRPLLTSFINFGAAERYDALLRPPSPGTYRLTVAERHWITNRIIDTKVIPVRVT